MSADLALQPEDLNYYEEEELEQQNRRSLQAVKFRDKSKESSSKLQDEVADKLKQEAVLAARRVTIRFINSAFAATIVGIIVSYLIMTVQFIAGNFFKSKIIPALSFIEIGIWIFASVIILLAIIGALTVGATLAAVVYSPFEMIGEGAGLLWDLVTSWYN